MRNSFSIAVVLCLLFSFLAPTTFAGGGSENILVVVNGKSWASKAIANEYVRLRNIAPTNVVYLNDLPDLESTDVETFRKKILLPVLEAAQSRGLGGQIDYITYSSDIPYVISVKEDVVGHQVSKIITQSASINGLTFLYQHVMAKQPSYLSLNVNRYYRHRLPFQSMRVNAELQVKLVAAAKAVREKNWEEAAKQFVALLDHHPMIARWHYDLAICYAAQDKTNEALASLQKASDAGWDNAVMTSNAEQFESIKENQTFQKLLKQIENQPLQLQPTLGFKAGYEWNESGDIVASGGHRYLLSTMLASTTGRGNSVSEALAYLKRSVNADGTDPQGTVYYVVNNDVRSKTRMGSFEAAIERLKQFGVKAEKAGGSVPQRRDDVLGAMLGIATFSWKPSGSIILPGAICENLTSYGGVMNERGGQTPLSELLRNGAAAASGTVTEPYAIQAKFPHPFMHSHYVQGSSLAEAFYQSLHGPYQLLIVGDPLCQPFATIPEVTLKGISETTPIKGKLELTPSVSSKEPIKRYELFVDGIRRAISAPGKTLDIDTSSLPDGYHFISVVATVDSPIATQGRKTQWVQINNHDSPKMIVAPPQPVTLDQAVELTAKLPGARQITFFHNRRPVATIRGEQGTVKIDAQELGQGEIELHPIGLLTDGLKRVWGKPIKLTIHPPRMLPALVNTQFKDLTPGIRLTQDVSKEIIVQDTYPADWLRKAGFKENNLIQLETYFEVPTDDVYQFQILTKMPLQLSVDTKTVPLIDPGEWQCIPVSLAKGTHLFKLEGKVDSTANLKIRFGGPGSYSLKGSRFRYREGG